MVGLGFNLTAQCETCKLFLPVMDCDVCKTSHCERHIVPHAQKHRESLDHARLASGGTDKQLFRMLGL